MAMTKLTDQCHRHMFSLVYPKPALPFIHSYHNITGTRHKIRTALNWLMVLHFIGAVFIVPPTAAAERRIRLHCLMKKLETVLNSLNSEISFLLVFHDRPSQARREAGSSNSTTQEGIGS